VIHVYAEGESPEASETLEREFQGLVEAIMQGEEAAART
jgi:hypothetical protein